MKKIIKPISIILSVVFIIGVAFVGGYFIGIKQLPKAEIVDNPTKENDLKLPGEVEKRIITIEEIKSKLNEISELSTYESRYVVTKGGEYSRHMLDDIPVPGTTNKVTIKCEGVVKVGYDLTEIQPVLDTKSNIIYIALPEIKVNDNYVIWESIECVEDNNILNPIDFNQYKQLALEIEELGLKDAESKGIYKNGEAYVQELIINFFGCFEGYEVKFI